MCTVYDVPVCKAAMHISLIFLQYTQARLARALSAIQVRGSVYPHNHLRDPMTPKLFSTSPSSNPSSLPQSIFHTSPSLPICQILLRIVQNDRSHPRPPHSYPQPLERFHDLITPCHLPIELPSSLLIRSKKTSLSRSWSTFIRRHDKLFRASFQLSPQCDQHLKSSLPNRNVLSTRSRRANIGCLIKNR